MSKLLKGLSFSSLNIEIYKLLELINDSNKKYKTKQVQSFINNISDGIVDYSRYIYSQTDLESDFLSNMVEYGETLTNLVGIIIAQDPEQSKRNLWYELWVHIMNACYLKGDFLSTTCIYLNFINVDIDNIIDKKSISKTSKNLLKKFDIINNELIKSGLGINTHMKLERSYETPIIPAINSFLIAEDNTRNIMRAVNEYYGEIKSTPEFKQILYVPIKRQEKMMLKAHEHLSDFELTRPLSSRSQRKFDKFKRNTIKGLTQEFNQLTERYRLVLTEQYSDLTDISGGYIPERLQDISTIKPVFDFLERTIEANSRLAKVPSHENNILSELLDETRYLLEKNSRLVERVSEEIVTENRKVEEKCVRRIKEISKIFNLLKSPERKDVSREIAIPTTATPPKERLDGLTRCNSLLYEIKSKVQKIESISISRSSNLQVHGFFNHNQDGDKDAFILREQESLSNDNDNISDSPHL